MKKRRESRRVTLLYLSALHMGVVGMFAVVFMPPPAPIAYATQGVVDHTVGKPQNNQPVTGTVNRLVVSSVGIDVPVRSGEYNVDSRSWSIDDTAAFHADTTVPVNNTNGKTLIYGHARWPIFATLPEVRAGAEAYVYTSEGIRFIYIFEASWQVDPRDTSALVSTGPPTLLLQTCSGAFDSYRTLVAFRLKGVDRDSE